MEWIINECSGFIVATMICGIIFLTFIGLVIFIAMFVTAFFQTKTINKIYGTKYRTMDLLCAEKIVMNNLAPQHKKQTNGVVAGAFASRPCHG